MVFFTLFLSVIKYFQEYFVLIFQIKKEIYEI